MTITPATLTRSAGVAAVAAGVIFIGVQINHPHLDVASVTTTEWAVRDTLKVLMAALALVGITGMYLRQVRRIGLLGLIGYVLFAAGYLTIVAHPSSRRTSCPPSLKPAPPTSTMFSPSPPAAALSATSAALKTVFQVAGVAFLAGGLVFGIALYRARVLARWAAALLAVGGVITATLAVLPDSLLPVPGLPERHRHDRPRLFALGHRAQRYPDAPGRPPDSAPRRGGCRMTRPATRRTRRAVKGTNVGGSR